MFIRKYGKKEFLKLQEKLHKKYKFSKTQEILGQDMKEGLKILEETGVPLHGGTKRWLEKNTKPAKEGDAK